MIQSITGTVHGNTIVLDAPPGVPEGERVEVIVRASEGVRQDADSSESKPPAWWTEEDDRILDEIYRARKRSTRSEVAE